MMAEGCEILATLLARSPWIGADIYRLFFTFFWTHQKLYKSLSPSLNHIVMPLPLPFLWNLLFSHQRIYLMIRDYEKDAIFAIFVRALEAQRMRDEAKRRIDEAQEDYANAKAVLRAARTAVTVFGFEESDTIWKEVRTALGEERLSKARELAGFKGRDDSSDTETSASDSFVESEDGSDESETPAEQLDENIKNHVLRRLRQAGEKGAKAVDIRNSLRSDGVEMHDKTVGMTLYRLSKEGVSRRDGRTWFAVEAENLRNSSEGTAAKLMPSGIFE
jgi:hypothetical protein